MKAYGRDIGQLYVNDGIQKKDPIKMATGAVMLPLSVLLEGPDQIWSGITGQTYEAPSGIAGRTRRDAKLLVKDVFTLHPLRALGDGWRLLTSDWILDGGDAIGGHRLNSARSATRTEISHALAA